MFYIYTSKNKPGDLEPWGSSVQAVACNVAWTEAYTGNWNSPVSASRLTLPSCHYRLVLQ